MNSKVRELVRQGYTLVTASARQASRLRFDYARSMMGDGHRAWEAPDILPWQSWLTRFWDRDQYSRQSGLVLLNPSQQYFLWQDVIQSSAYSRQLLQLKPVIQQAIEAWELCLAWQIPIFPEDVYLNQDARVFKSWADEYQTRLKQHRWIDLASVPEWLMTGDLASGEKLAFYGFDELTPQQLKFIDGLLAQGNEITIIEPEHHNKQTRYFAFSDDRDELRSAALWARDIINRDPDARVGLVVPNLQSVRQLVTAVFDNVFHPELLVQDHDHVDRVYSITLGRSLADYPLIHIALELLSLGRTRHTLNRLGQLLRSTFIKGALTDCVNRARFDAALREAGESQWHINKLIPYAEHQLGDDQRSAEFLEMLRQSEAFFHQTTRSQSPRDWAIRFDEYLKIWGWPGERELDSVEYQTLDAWKEALGKLASLNSVIKTCNYQTALSHLVKIVSDSSFQPETTESPVQISALPGAAAMQSDYLWITGLHDQSWPPSLQVSPFIPLPLQRDAMLPASSAQLTLQRTRELTASLVASAGEVIFSYPRMDGERECRPSPLLRQYMHENSGDVINEQEDYRLIIHKSGMTESLVDVTAPAVKTGSRAAGGSAIFKDQAACPFRAFARHRLHARSLADINIGLDPAVRGQLAHNAMQKIWQALQSSDGLKQISDRDLEKTVTACVSAVVKQQARRQPESFTARFSELEVRRLQTLVLNSLELERERPSFRVREIEQWHKARIGDLEIRMRIDRIDELADGRMIVLDYKTGQVRTADWDGERPGDPQLPLYAVSADGEVAAIAYASLKHGKYGFTGLAEADGLLPGVETAMDKDTGELLWASRLQEWKTVLTQLARDFVEGKAVVDPKDNNSCRYCDLHTLCRIHELQAMSLADVNDTDLI
ncbi:MAG: PD-(D/E)XK nuclease family protein [Gammaproteobacteria bacterium]